MPGGMSGSGDVPAGWYPDPTSPGVERWWDGHAWSTQARAAGAPAPLPPSAGPSGQQRAPYAYTPPAPSTPAKRSGCLGIATGVMLGIVGAFVLIVGGCTALIVAGSSNDDRVSATTAVPSGQAPSTAPSTSPAGGDEAADAVSCTRVDKDTIVIELLNHSSKSSSYSLTIGYFDDGGQRVGDGAVFVNHLRPGERAIEETFVFEDVGTVCEIVSVERMAAESNAGELDEAGACQLGDAANVLGSFDATVSATNGSPETSNYLIDVALVDSDNVRRGIWCRGHPGSSAGGVGTG